MRILYIAPRFPFPPDQGNKVVIYNQIKFLSKRNKITLLAFTDNKNEEKNFEEFSRYCAKIETFKRAPNFSLKNFVFAMYKSDPFNVIRYFSKEMFTRSRELIESRQFDVIHVAYYYMAQYAIDKTIKIPKTTALVLDTHNIESLLYSQYARLSRNPFVKLLIKLESVRIKNYEAAIYGKFDKCITFSELDRKNIGKIYDGSNIAVNPACSELQIPDNSVSYLDEEENTILYFGWLKYFANDDAVRFFYKKIFPIIKKEIPEIKFIIAGGNPSQYVKDLSKDPNVKILGFVPDIHGLMKKTSLVIVPLRLGGGTRVKILESWAMGKAVVTTSIGAEGVDITSGKDAVIADSAVDFSKAVINLLKDKKKRTEIGIAAMEKIRNYYNPEKVIMNLEKIYAEALEKKSSKKIKVLHISQATGGVQRHVISILERINRDRFEIVGICPPRELIKGVSKNKESFTQAFTRIGVRVYPVKMTREIRPIDDMQAFLKIYKFIKKEKFNIVHTHSSKAGFLGRIAARLAGVKVIIHTPNSFAFDRPAPMLLQRKFYALLEKFASLFCDKIIAVCEDEKRLAVRFLGLPPDKVELINNAIDISLQDMKNGAVNKKEEFGIKETDKTVILVGRMSYQKAPLDFVKAAVEVKKNFSNVKFLLLGDGPLSNAVIRYIEKNRLSNFVKFIGWHNNPKQVTAASDIFVLSSRWEALPYSVLDAMALEKPIVTTNTLFAREFVVDGYNGFVVQKERPDLLAKAILKLCKLSEKELLEFGKHSKEILIKKPSLNNTVKQTEDLYERLVRE